MKNSGKLYKTDDGRFVILYDFQPLFQSKGIVIFNLVDDENYRPLLDDNHNPRIMIKGKPGSYDEFIKKCTLIGFID